MWCVVVGGVEWMLRVAASAARRVGLRECAGVEELRDSSTDGRRRGEFSSSSRLDGCIEREASLAVLLNMQQCPCALRRRSLVPLHASAALLHDASQRLQLLVCQT